MANIPFTSNYQDLSSDGATSSSSSARSAATATCRPSRPTSSAAASAAANVAASLFGGIFGRAGAGRRPDPARGRRPAARLGAQGGGREISPIFKQCTRCGNWVCEPVCWNKKAGLCESCAPDLDEEIAAAQAEAAREQVQTRRASVDYLGQRDLAQVVAAVCPSAAPRRRAASSAPSAAPRSAPSACQHCGAEADGTPKFCPECGKAFGT